MTKYLLISGGTKGLGAAISKRFSQEYLVTALYRTDEQAAKMLQQRDKIRCVRHDITLAPYAMPPMNSEDELVVIHNAAARFIPTPMHLSDLNQYRAQWDVAIGGAHNLIYPCLRQLVNVSRGTVIAVLTSAVVGLPPKGFAPYTSAKQALKGFIESVSVEFGGRGVRSFSVSPGFMDTEMTQAWDERMRHSVGAGNILTTEHAADRIYQLAHEDSTKAAGENYLLVGQI